MNEKYWFIPEGQIYKLALDRVIVWHRKDDWLAITNEPMLTKKSDTISMG